MGNANEVGFISDGAADVGDEELKHDGTIHLPEPKDGKQSIFMSQYAMNLYGVTNASEFETNALAKVPESHRVKQISEIFKYKKKLGAGASARVLLVQSKQTKKFVALKEISRKFKVHAQMFLREVIILESLKHDNILEFFDIFIDRKAYYISTAYYSGGEFFDRIIKMKKFSERQALTHIFPIVKAVEFMHSQFIVHRDLKPSNMVFDKKGSNGKIKIIDFGTSEIVIDEDQYPFERVGTILFCAPEWNRDRTGLEMKKSDMWAVGVICYVLMVGRLPFGEWKDIESFNGRLWFPPKLIQKLSRECKDFLHKLLCPNVKQRLSATAALKHPWLANHMNAYNKDLGLEVLSNLGTMYQVNKVKRIIAKGNLDEITVEDRNILLNKIQTEADVMSFLQEAYKDTPQSSNTKTAEIFKRKNDNQNNPNDSNQQNNGLINARVKEVLDSIEQFKQANMAEENNNNSNNSNSNNANAKLPDINENSEANIGSVGKFEDNSMNFQKSFVQEDHQEYEFETGLVDKLMELGLASKNACMRAVIAVEGKSIEAAADWLLQHGSDDGVDLPVDVV